MKPISADEMMVVVRSQSGESGSPSCRSQSPWWKYSTAPVESWPCVSQPSAGDEEFVAVPDRRGSGRPVVTAGLAPARTNAHCPACAWTPSPPSSSPPTPANPDPCRPHLQIAQQHCPNIPRILVAPSPGAPAKMRVAHSTASALGRACRRYLSGSISVSFSISLSISLSFSMSLCLRVCRSVSLNVCLFPLAPCFCALALPSPFPLSPIVCHTLTLPHSHDPTLRQTLRPPTRRFPSSKKLDKNCISLSPRFLVPDWRCRTRAAAGTAAGPAPLRAKLPPARRCEPWPASPVRRGAGWRGWLFGAC